MIKKRTLGAQLIHDKKITQEQLERALQVKEHSDKKIGQILIDLGYASEDVIAEAVSKQLGKE